jgi:hypothetical protein
MQMLEQFNFIDLPVSHRVVGARMREVALNLLDLPASAERDIALEQLLDVRSFYVAAAPVLDEAKA